MKEEGWRLAPCRQCLSRKTVLSSENTSKMTSRCQIPLGPLKMTTTPHRATAILALLFVSSAFGEVIFSRRVYKEHGASY